MVELGASMDPGVADCAATFPLFEDVAPAVICGPAA